MMPTPDITIILRTYVTVLLICRQSEISSLAGLFELRIFGIKKEPLQRETVRLF